MRVILVNPPQDTGYPLPPMGLSLLAAVLERKGHRVTVVDANALNLKPEGIAPHITNADVIGITAMTPTINAAINIAHHLKQNDSHSTIILGGAHASLLSEETLTTASPIDIVVRGEGEETIIELLQALEEKQPLDNIPGISYRRNGEVINTPARSTTVDLDSLPFLAHQLLPWKRYKPYPPYGRALPFTTLITSRGCPYACSFCSKPVFGNKFRGQSPERVVDEIACYKEKFGIKEVAFHDDIFTLSKRRAHAIADEVMKRGIKIYWTCETRVNLVDKDLLRHMKQAGCYAIAYGIESASQQILDIFNKGITLEQVEEAVRLSQEVGLLTIGYFMIGSPGDSRETITKTIEFAKRLRLDFAQFGITIPFPGTKLYELYLKGKGEEIPWENFVYDKTSRQITPIFESNELSRASLQHWVQQAYKEFYLRPSYFWQRIRQVTSIGDLKVNIKGLSILLGNTKLF